MINIDYLLKVIISFTLIKVMINLCSLIYYAFYFDKYMTFLYVFLWLIELIDIALIPFLIKLNNNIYNNTYDQKSIFRLLNIYYVVYMLLCIFFMAFSAFGKILSLIHISLWLPIGSIVTTILAFPLFLCIFVLYMHNDYEDVYAAV